MTGGEIAAILGALTTFIGGAYGTWRLGKADRSKTRVDTAATLISGWKDFQSSTFAEVERVRRESQQQIAELKVEHDAERAADRAAWEREKAEMQREIDRLRLQVDQLILREQRNGHGN